MQAKFDLLDVMLLHTALAKADGSPREQVAYLGMQKRLVEALAEQQADCPYMLFEDGRVRVLRETPIEDLRAAAITLELSPRDVLLLHGAFERVSFRSAEIPGGRPAIIALYERLERQAAELRELYA